MFCRLPGNNSKMISFVFILSVIFSICNASSMDGWDGMKIKYSPTRLGADTLAFFTVPDNITHGKTINWVEVAIDNHYNLKAMAREKASDFGLNGLYDANGNLAGIHACQPYATLNASGPVGYNILKEGAFEEKTVGGNPSICTSMLIVSPATLKAGGRKTMAPYGEGIWVRDTTNTDTYYTEIPTNTTLLKEKTNYARKQCIPNMGSHYFWDTHPHDCTQHNNWFFIGHDSKETIHGVGITMYGHSHKDWTDWWEHVNRYIVQYINRDQLECSYENISKYGMFTMHIYLVNDPWNIKCYSGDQ